MPSTSETILSANTHPGDSTVETVTGLKFKGDGYYGRSDGLHTIQYTLTKFLGTIKIEATLAVDPIAEDWFEVLSQTYTPVNNEGTTGSFISNFTGNYVWVRAVVTYTDGTINSIILNH